MILIQIKYEHPNPKSVPKSNRNKINDKYQSGESEFGNVGQIWIQFMKILRSEWWDADPDLM